MRAYTSFFKKSLQAHLAYGGAFFVSLLANGVGFALTLLVWRHAWRGDEAQRPAFFAYLTLAFAVNFALNLFLERSIGERIREGLIATDLVKPVDFQRLYLAQSLSDMLFQVLLALAAVAVAVPFLGTSLLPATPAYAAYGFLSLGLAFFVQYFLCFVFVQGIFITYQNYGVFATRLALHQALSGVFAPLDSYPPLLRSVAHALPFQHVVYTPTSIYLGRVPLDFVPTLLLRQALWALALYLLGRWIFSLVLRQLTVQGG